jgi:short-subunit dehydrogenase
VIPRPPSDLRGTVAVLTGASSGIGRATALALAGRGADVVLAARSPGSLGRVAGLCRASGGRVLTVVTDVVDEAAVEELARRAAAEFGRIDVWVNNAAVMVYGRFEDTPSEVHRHVIETNLMGVIHGTRAVLPYFRREGKGTLVNVASQYAKMTSPYVSAYVASKSAVLAFSEVLRQELHDARGIHVCTVLPGSVDTPIFRHAGNYDGREARPVPPVGDPDRVVRAILRCIVHPKSEITVGNVARVFNYGHLLFPPLYDRLAPLVMDHLAFGPPGGATGPGNVFEPEEDLNGVSGGWRNAWVRVGGIAAALAVGASAARLKGSRRRRRRGTAGTCRSGS